MPEDSKAIDKKALFARLAEGHAAGITVVTPNRRLARFLRGEFDAFQIGKGLPVWEDADILPLESFVERLYEDSLYADPQGGQPQLLSAAQERALWESVVARSGLLAIAETAEKCAEAWTLAHRWRIDGAAFSNPGKVESSDDARAFAGWAADYAKRCRKEGWIDAARLPDLKLSDRKPKLLVAYGFEAIPPQSLDLISKFEFSYCSPERKKTSQVKTPFPSARHELEAAAKWARGRLERGAKRIGVVVPDLGRRRREVVRVFTQVMGTRRPFDVSLGEPLKDFPIVAFALSLLELSFSELEFDAASRLIRSPFIGGADGELAARALLDVRLRRRLGARVSLAKLISESRECGALRSLLEKIFQIKEKSEKSQSPHAWAQVFTSILEAAGFPGERAPDTAEFQARMKFNEILRDFAKLTFVLKKSTGEEAIQTLKILCTTLFQPESAQAPVQVLGVLESLGIEFDALWLSGMTEEAWPLRASPNPFLPIALQKKAGIPEASAESSLARARQITAAWSGAARDVVWSYPAREQDRDLLPSPLIREVPENAIQIEEYQSYRDLLFSSRVVETLHDEKAPEVTAKTIKGGTRVLADQSACPFRAFARWRLAAEPLEEPPAGPDARARGQLLHELMAVIWKELGSSLSLSRDLKPVIEKAAKTAVHELGLEGRFAELEIARLTKLAREWLEIEKVREAFEVAGLEKKLEIKAAGLSLKGRIDRLDRLADGSHALIDYKSGRASTKDWMGERPDDPQLPLYALSAGVKIGAVAFARLKTGELGFVGFSRDKDALPGVKESPDWDSLFAGWKAETGRIAGQFAGGDARVDPKRLLQTCRFCALQPLCRVHERLDSLDDTDLEGG